MMVLFTVKFKGFIDQVDVPEKVIRRGFRYTAFYITLILSHRYAKRMAGFKGHSYKYYFIQYFRSHYRPILLFLWRALIRKRRGL